MTLDRVYGPYTSLGLEQDDYGRWPRFCGSFGPHVITGLPDVFRRPAAPKCERLSSFAAVGCGAEFLEVWAWVPSLPSTQSTQTFVPQWLQYSKQHVLGGHFGCG